MLKRKTVSRAEEPPGEPAVEITNVEKMRGLKWAVVMNTANQIFAYLTLFGSVVVLFLDLLGFSKSQIGMTLALLYITGVLTVFLIRFVSRIGFKRSFQIFMSARAAALLLLLFTPYVLEHYGQTAVLWLVFVAVALFAFFRTLAITGWMPWSREYVPDAVRGKFTAINNIFASISGFLTVLVAGWVIGDSQELHNFMYLFGASFLFAMITVVASRGIPGGKPIKIAQTSHREQIIASLKDNAFLLYLVGIGLITLSTEPMNAFIPLFLSEEIGLSAGHAIYIQAASMLGGILTSYLWGWAADRYGSKPVMMLGLFFRAAVPLLWFVMPRESIYVLLLALLISFISGVASFGFSIGASRMLFVNIVPEDKSGDYMAVYSTWGGITWAISQLTGGWILDSAQNLSGTLWIFSIDSYMVLFLLALTVPLFSAWLLNKIRAKSEVSPGQFAAMFLHGNPFMAFNSMIRFQRAKDERSTVSVTERLGQSRSPLNVEELLEALGDPRFNVRFEAIISIARTDTDPRLTKALCTMLERGEPALSVVAAWALGRIGDQQAIDALRRGLNAPFRSVQAYSARSLGTLQDQAVRQPLLQRFSEEDDEGLRIAYTAALSKLGAVEAVPEMLTLLQNTDDHFLRMEIALAVGSLVGEEAAFIHLLRSIRQDLGTTASQTLIEINHRLESPEWSELHQILAASIDAFSQGALDNGAQILSEMVMALEMEPYPKAVAQVLHTSAGVIHETRLERIDFLILLLHTLSHHLGVRLG